MNSQFNTSNWTGRTHRTRNEAFGPASDNYHGANGRRMPVKGIAAAGTFVLLFGTISWLLSPWF